MALDRIQAGSTLDPFCTATSAPQEILTQHGAWPTLWQPSLSHCHGRLPELCAHHLQGTRFQALCLLTHLTRLEGKPSALAIPLAQVGGPLESHSTATVPLETLLPSPTPLQIFHPAEGSKHHGAGLQMLPWKPALVVRHLLRISCILERRQNSRFNIPHTRILDFNHVLI